uniref:ATP synthase F0 subunit 8 n=1 Tax=Erythrocystis saccata TaxID=2822695 RepID=A0A8E6L6V4_9FLOR|nr:ATP synthase F0 subunit 8 [Erythrocystis saccata]
MPQLDILIILPQIFWFIIFFIIFYYTLTYYFLPFFLQTINARKYFLQNNKIIENRLITEIIEKRKLMLNELNSNFHKIRSVLFLKLFHTKFNFQTKKFNNYFSKLNTKICIAVNNSILYCNPTILDIFEFYPKVLNKNKK